MLIHAAGTHVEVRGGTEAVLRELRSTLTLPNPRYVGCVRSGKVPIGIDKVVRYYRKGDDGCLVLPSACAGLAVAAARRHGVACTRTKELRELQPVNFAFRGDLRLYQVAASAQVQRYDHGVLDAPTGSGKTVIGCAVIADRRQPTLVIVHSCLLQEQWFEAARQWIGLERSDIGLIGGDRPTDINAARGRPLLIGIINTVHQVAGIIAPAVGHVVVDECHRVVAPTYLQALRYFDCRYRLGLSATPYRRDGLDDVIKWLLGPVTKVARAPLIASGAVLPAEIEQVRTTFTTDIDGSEHYQAVIGELVMDGPRAGLISREASSMARNGLTLVLSDRKDHCERLQSLHPPGSCSVVLHGGLSKGAREQCDAQIRGGGVEAIYATTQLVGEGWDRPAAQTLILATPIKFSGRLLQAIGRVLRPAPGKTAGRIIDFCDWGVPVLAAGARARAKTYRELALAERGTG